MKNKQIIILGVILLLLVVGVIIRQAQKPVELVTTTYEGLNLSFDPLSVGRIQILRMGKASDEENPGIVQLVYSEGSWRVATQWDALADSQKIEAFMDEILNAKGELRGESLEILSDFGIEDDASYKVVLSDPIGSQLLSFHLGMVKTDFQSIFVRQEGESKVYMTDANLFGVVGIYGDPAKDSLNQDFWVDTALFHFDKNKANRIEVRQLGSNDGFITASVERIGSPEEKKWRFTGSAPFAMDPTKVENFLSTLQGLRARNVTDPASQNTSLENPILQIILGIEDQDGIVAMVDAKNEETNNHQVQVSGQPVFYELSSYYINNLNIDDSQFFISNPLQVDSAKTEKLVVKTSEKTFKIGSDPEKWPPQYQQYLNDLKKLQIKRLLLDPKERGKVSSPGKRFLEIQMQAEAEPRILDVGSKLDQEGAEYAAVLRGRDQPFAIDGAFFKNAFETPERLKG